VIVVVSFDGDLKYDGDLKCDRDLDTHRQERHSPAGVASDEQND
jgi:hypothetical protein